MKCNNCGKEIDDNETVCKYCGSEVKKENKDDYVNLSINLDSTNVKKESNKKILPIIIGALCLVVIFIVIVSSSTKSSSSSSNNEFTNMYNDSNTSGENNEQEQESEQPQEKYSDSEELFADVASTFKYYYLSYLEASNQQNADWIDHCSEELRDKQEQRIFKNNAGYTFYNNYIYIDMDSYYADFYDNNGSSYFKVYIENDAYKTSNNQKILNTPTFEVDLEYIDDQWIVVDSNVVKESAVSNNLRDITNY